MCGRACAACSLPSLLLLPAALQVIGRQKEVVRITQILG